MSLPRPYFELDGVRLYKGDALELLPLLSADAVLTDPPYGLGFEGETWDASIPEWLPLARRAAPVVAFTTAPTTLWDYPRPDWLAAYSRQGATTRTSSGGFCHWTPVLVYGRDHLAVDFMRSNDSRAHLEAPKGHPCPKPVPVFEWLVEGCNPLGGLVLDPFAGSGTTLLAARERGRRAVGIEREERYLEVAVSRLQQRLLDFEVPT